MTHITTEQVTPLVLIPKRITRYPYAIIFKYDFKMARNQAYFQAIVYFPLHPFIDDDPFCRTHHYMNCICWYVYYADLTCHVTWIFGSVFQLFRCFTVNLYASCCPARSDPIRSLFLLFSLISHHFWFN